jgi:hypothetical protein
VLTGQMLTDNFGPPGARFNAPRSAQWFTELVPVGAQNTSVGRASPQRT